MNARLLGTTASIATSSVRLDRLWEPIRRLIEGEEDVRRIEKEVQAHAALFSAFLMEVCMETYWKNPADEQEVAVAAVEAMAAL